MKTKTKKQTKLAVIQPASAPIETEAPDWVNVTPGEASYGLAMWEGGGGEEQRADLSREEFVLLKRLVAALRGYELRAPLDAWERNQRDDAYRLRIAQDEIKMVLGLESAMDALCLNFRKRLNLGASVEEGKWRLENQQGADDMALDDISGINRRGLGIYSAEEAKSAAS